MPAKYYVVWKGRKPGVYSNWASCAEQVMGFPNARYKGYTDRDEAYAAYRKDKSHNVTKVDNVSPLTREVVGNSREPFRPLLKKPASESELITQMRILLDKIVSELRIWRMKHPK